MKTATASAFQLNQAYWPLHHASHASDQGQLNLRRRLKNLFGTLLAQMEGTAGPRVWATRDAADHMLWNAYDSASGKTIRQASETELRVWLESRYQF